MIDWTDASGSPAPCGYVGFQGNGTNANYYDNLKILRSTQTYPVVYDTIPAIITYAGGSAADTTHGAAINSGGTVSWNLFTSLADTAYSLTWWGTVNYCGDAYKNLHWAQRIGCRGGFKFRDFECGYMPAEPDVHAFIYGFSDADADIHGNSNGNNDADIYGDAYGYIHGHTYSNSYSSSA